MAEQVFSKPLREISSEDLLRRISWYANNSNYKSIPGFTVELIRDLCDEWLEATLDKQKDN